MTDIITTLHPENDENINLYPNIKRENIPNGAVTKEKIVTGLKENITLENKLIDTFIINKDSVETQSGLYNSQGEHYPGEAYQCVEINVAEGNYLVWEQLQLSNWQYVAYASSDGVIHVTENTAGKKYLDLKDVKKLFINFFGDAYCADFKLVKNGTTLKLSNKIVVNKNTIAYRQGVFFSFNDYRSEYDYHQCSYVLDCSNLKSITFNSQVNPVADIYWKDKNNNFYSCPTNQSGMITIDVSNAVQIAFNFRDEKNVSYVITFKNADEITAAMATKIEEIEARLIALEG